jgi:hypothetical protein
MKYSESERSTVIPSIAFTRPKMSILEDREVSESVESRNRLLVIDLFAVMKHFTGRSNFKALSDMEVTVEEETSKP